MLLGGIVIAAVFGASGLRSGLSHGSAPRAYDGRRPVSGGIQVPTLMPEARVRLLEVEPEFGRFLSDEERGEARALTLPVVRVAKDQPEVGGALATRHAFGALVLDGMLLQRMRVGGQEAMRLIGSGEVLGVDASRTTSLLEQSGWRAVADSRLIVLGHDFLLAARRWPGLFAGVHARSAEQTERVNAHLVICQLPRVADRLLGIMWLLAETWGRVTPAGVTLPLVLTHEALGSLIGARRPTVSLAIAELVERGAVVRQSEGWLLLEPFVAPAHGKPSTDMPVPFERGESVWDQPTAAAAAPQVVARELLETVHRVRAEAVRVRAEMDATLAEVRRNRERIMLRRAGRAR